jgi:hypothetical protein
LHVCVSPFHPIPLFHLLQMTRITWEEEADSETRAVLLIRASTLAGRRRRQKQQPETRRKWRQRHQNQQRGGAPRSDKSKARSAFVMTTAGSGEARHQIRQAFEENSATGALPGSLRIQCICALRQTHASSMNSSSKAAILLQGSDVHDSNCVRACLS